MVSRETLDRLQSLPSRVPPPSVEESTLPTQHLAFGLAERLSEDDGAVLDASAPNTADDAMTAAVVLAETALCCPIALAAGCCCCWESEEVALLAGLVRSSCRVAEDLHALLGHLLPSFVNEAVRMVVMTFVSKRTMAFPNYL